MKDIECDILVVGGGPGGSMAARYAAQEGMNTLMIEKRQEIGSPVRCGEGLSLHFVDEVGLEIKDCWKAIDMEGARIIAPDGTKFAIDASQAGNEVGCNVNRDYFDKELAKEAAQAGAKIMLKTSAVDVLKDGNTVIGVRARHLGEEFDIKAKVVIGADGFESQVGRWAGIDTNLKPRDIVTCLQYHMVGIECNPDFNDFYIGSEAPGAYAWVFPKGPDRANVGLGVQLTKCKEPGFVKKCLDSFIKRRPELRKGSPTEIVAGAVSTCAPPERTVCSGLILVGDAARVIDPLTGGGIVNACITGMLAGQMAAKAVKADDVSETFLHQYEKQWREKLEDQLYRNWMAKNTAAKLTDETFNKIVHAIKEVKIDEISTLSVLSVIQDQYPEVMDELSELL